MSTKEELAKRTKLSQFANSHGYSDLEELIAEMTAEQERVHKVISSWNGVQPTTGEKIKKSTKQTPRTPDNQKHLERSNTQ